MTNTTPATAASSRGFCVSLSSVSWAALAAIPAVPSWTPAFNREGPKPLPCVALEGGGLFAGAFPFVGFGFAAGVRGALFAVTLGLAGILQKQPHFYLDC